MPSSDYTPEVADVARFLRTRTRDTNGAELGTFTSDTRPTADAVTAIIADTVTNMEDDLGVDIDERLWQSAKRVTALRAAMEIEVSYFSEQVAADRSVYPQLKEWYEEDLDKLNIAIVETAEGGEPGTDAGENTPLWGGGDDPFFPSSSLFTEFQSQETGWPEGLGALRNSFEQRTADALGAQTDAASTTPSTGSVLGYLRKIRDLLSGTLNVNIVSGGGGGGGGGGLTDFELRAAPVIVDPGAGPFDVNVVSTVSGASGLTDSELRAAPVEVDPGTVHVIVDSGVAIGLTDAELRATPVPVSGPLTDTQLRNSAVPVSAASLPLPAGAATAANQASILAGVGAPTDAAAATTGSLIAQARRIANLLAGTLTVSGTVAVSGSVPVTGPLTDAQLRAAAVPVSAASLPLPTGAATETTLAAVSAVLGAAADAASSTTGTVNAHLRSIAAALAGTLTVTTGLTDTQLRATAVPVSIAATLPVSGPLTDAQLRALAVPVSLASVPSHPVTNAGTFAVQDSLADTALGAPGDAAATTTGSVIAQLRRVANLLAGTLTATVSGTVAISGSVAVTGPLTDTQIRATALQISGTVTANAGTGTFAISAASLPLPTGAALDATLTGGTQKSINRGGAKGATAAADVTSTASGADHAGLDVVLYDASGNRLGTSGTPVRTDPTGTTAQPITAAALPLPAGAATETSAALAATALGAPGDAAATTTGSVVAQLRRIANLLAGTLTVNTGTVAVTGTFFQATQPVSAASLPLPTGASTETSLAALLATAGAVGDAAASGSGTMNAHLRSIATALAGTLTVTGGGGGVQFAEDVAHANGDLGTMALGVRKDTAAALAGTDGDYMPMIFDASGKLHVNPGTVAVTGTFFQATQPVSAASLPLPTGAATSAKQPALGTAGAASADVITVQGIASGTAQNIAAASLPLPTGAATEATSAALLAILGASADAASSTTGTINAHLRSIAAALAGTLTVASHAVTNAGTFAVQADTELPTAAALADATANPTVPAIGTFLHLYNGATWDRIRGDTANGLDVDVTRLPALATGTNTIGTVRGMESGGQIDDLGTTRTVKFGIIDAALNGDNTLLAAVASRKIRVLSLWLVASGTTTVRFESGAGGTALSGQANLVANSGFVLGYNPHGHFETAVNTLLNLELSAAVSVDGGFTYVEIA